jgi:hypothetical protein
VLLFFVAGARLAQADTRVPVFHASVESVPARQSALNDELGAAGISVTVFGRYQDFSSEVERQKPAFVIAPASFGKGHAEYKAVLGFQKDGKTTSPAVLLALTKEALALSPEKARLGLVQDTDRDKVEGEAQRITGHKYKSIKTVTKVEDLIPLLMFRSADVVLVESDALPKLREKFTTPTFRQPVDLKVDNPCVLVREGADPGKSLEAFRKLSPKTLKALGYTGISNLGGEG